MALRGDSYGTVVEVLAYSRELLDGQSTFNSTTRPTLTEMEKFIDRASGILNTSFNVQGLTTHITNSTAKLMCDAWVVEKATAYTEATKAGSGFDGSRTVSFSSMQEDALKFAEANALGFKRLGVVAAYPLSDGLINPAETVQADRTDPDDTSLEQPKFTRGKFDNE